IRHKGVHSHSPYKGWMKWHHYAGLIFGLVTLPSGEMGAFPHSQEAEGALAPFLVVCDSASVVTDGQDEFAVVLLHLNVDLRRLRMTQDVGQRFLGDAKGGCRLLSTQI